jgi:hypothetical protein
MRISTALAALPTSKTTLDVKRLGLRRWQAIKVIIRGVQALMESNTQVREAKISNCNQPYHVSWFGTRGFSRQAVIGSNNTVIRNAHKAVLSQPTRASLHFSK